MSLQLTLELGNGLPSIPDPSLPVVALLATNPEGLTADSIATALGLQPGETGRRRVRSLVSACRPWVVSGPGGRGYLHFKHATSDDLLEAARRLQSQGEKNLADATLYLSAYHARARTRNKK